MAVSATTPALPPPPCRIYDYDDEGVGADPDLADVMVVDGGEIRRLQGEVRKCVYRVTHLLAD